MRNLIIHMSITMVFVFAIIGLAASAIRVAKWIDTPAEVKQLPSPQDPDIPTAAELDRDSDYSCYELLDQYADVLPQLTDTILRDNRLSNSECNRLRAKSLTWIQQKQKQALMDAAKRRAAHE